LFLNKFSRHFYVIYYNLVGFINKLKEIMKKIVIATLVALSAIGAQAQTYGEIGYTTTTVKNNIDGFSIKGSPSAIRGILGYELNPNLAIEGLAAFGMSDATVKVNGVEVPSLKVEIANSLGIYLKPKMKLSDAVEIFGRIGFSRVKGTISAAGEGSESGSESSISYGAGLSFAVNPKTSLNADYMQYLSKDGFKVNGFTFGVGFKF
jgi:opacity protein-like surface antigen